MSRSRRTSRRLVKLTAVLGAGLAAVALIVVVLGPADDEIANDPSRKGPLRYLRITEARVLEGEAGPQLRLEAETNLVAGSRVSVSVLARGARVVSVVAESDGEHVRMQTPAAGSVVEGTYEALVEFRLDEQSEAVRVALAHQPTHLSDRRRLELPLRVVAAADARGEVQALFDDVNRAPRDSASLDALDRRAQELLARLWIAEQKAAIHKLRLAVEEARRVEFKRRDFDRLLLEAHVLAGL